MLIVLTFILLCAFEVIREAHQFRDNLKANIANKRVLSLATIGITSSSSLDGPR